MEKNSSFANPSTKTLALLLVSLGTVTRTRTHEADHRYDELALLVSFGVGRPWVGLSSLVGVIIEESLRVRCRSKIPKEGKEQLLLSTFSKEYTPRSSISTLFFPMRLLLSTHSSCQSTHT
jgi:hypothetical protein